MPKYFTGRGDQGYTGLLGKGRVPKYHPRPETYGRLDEASASLGLARSKASDESSEVLKAAQRDLYLIMSEVAATKEQAAQFRALEQDRVKWVEGEIDRFGDQIDFPKDFVVFGDTEADAALDFARTCVRRAERSVARLLHDGVLDNQLLLTYLNRLSSLCFVLALWENKSAGLPGPSLSKTK
jgi:cob(I)alamin adenosyltransferase